MKTLLENWNRAMSEVEELNPEDKTALFQGLQDQATELIGRINDASKGDANLAREAIQSLIVVFQNSLKGQ